MTSTQMEQRHRAAQAGIETGKYHITETHHPLRFLVSYQDASGRPVQYHVSLLYGQGACTCYDFARRGGPCKHLQMVKAHYEALQEFDRLVGELEAPHPEPFALTVPLSLRECQANLPIRLQRKLTLSPHFPGCRIEATTDLTEAEIREIRCHLVRKAEV